MKKISAAILLCAVCNLTLAVDPVTIKALERDLAGQTGVFQAQATKGSRHRGLVLVAGLAMIGTGTWLMATSRQTEHEYVPVVSSGGMVVDSYIIERDKIQPGRLYGGMALAGGGGILVWKGLKAMH